MRSQGNTISSLSSRKGVCATFTDSLGNHVATVTSSVNYRLIFKKYLSSITSMSQGVIDYCSRDPHNTMWLLDVYNGLMSLFNAIGPDAPQERYKAYGNASKSCEELGYSTNQSGTILKCEDTLMLMHVSGKKQEEANVRLDDMFGVGVQPGVIVYLNKPIFDVEINNKKYTIELKFLGIVNGSCKNIKPVLKMEGRIKVNSIEAPFLIEYVKPNNFVDECEYRVIGNVKINEFEMRRILCENREEIKREVDFAIKLIKRMLSL